MITIQASRHVIMGLQYHAMISFNQKISQATEFIQSKSIEPFTTACKVIVVDATII